MGRGIAVQVARHFVDPNGLIDVVHSAKTHKNKMRQTRIALVVEHPPSYAVALASTSESNFYPSE